MKIDKNQIIDMLKSKGKHDKADKASKDLPEQVDTDQHADKLNKLGVKPQDLGSGGLGDKLGG